MASRSEVFEPVFATWVDARGPELQRTAHLMSGDVGTARALVEAALTALLTVTPADEAELDPLALRVLVAGLLAGRAGALDRDVEETLDPRQALVWDFLSTLSPAQRATLVLHLHRQLDPGEISRIVGGTPASVADGVTAALEDLAGLMRVSAAEAETTATAALAARAEATPIVPTSVESVRAVARLRRSRRTRGGLLLAGAALVVVATPVVALSGEGLPAPSPAPAEPTPADAPGYAPEDRVPPPWVLPPGQSGLTFRVDIETRCASPSDEEFRSITTIRSGCRTVVIKPR